MWWKKNYESNSEKDIYGSPPNIKMFLSRKYNHRGKFQRKTNLV